MHVATSDLAEYGGSRTFTFRGITGTAQLRRELPHAEPHTPEGPTAAVAGESDAATRGGGRLDLVRSVVEQIVGRSLRATEIDSLAQRTQPVPLAFDHARKVEALERAREARARTQAAPATGAEAVAWGASLELRETVSGDGTFAVAGSLTTADGRDVAIEVRLVGDGQAAVLPLRLDIDLGPDGAPVRLGFAGRAVDAAGAAGTGEAATAAAWAGVPVRVREAAGTMTVTTLTDLRVSRGGDLGIGGSGHIDLVA